MSRNWLLPLAPAIFESVEPKTEQTFMRKQITAKTSDIKIGDIKIYEYISSTNAARKLKKFIYMFKI